MKVLIIYDDFDLAIKAGATLRLRANRSDFTIEWQVSPWRSNVLNHPAVAREALMDALDAHLMLFAVSCAGPTDPWLMDWLERWARRRQVEDAALAAITVSAAGSLCLSAATEIARFANRHGLGFVSDPGDDAGNPRDFLLLLRSVRDYCQR
jgi:hypothetical protein